MSIDQLKKIAWEEVKDQDKTEDVPTHKFLTMLLYPLLVIINLLLEILNPASTISVFSLLNSLDDILRLLLIVLLLWYIRFLVHELQIKMYWDLTIINKLINWLFNWLIY